MPKIMIDEDLGKKYGKPDMERLGIFVEMPFMNGKGYVSPFPKTIPAKGRNILGEGRKLKNGTQHGYFDDEFRRLYEGEAIPRPNKRKPEKRPTAPFLSAGITKWHSSPGDNYGCFSGNIEAFSNVRRPKPKYKREPGNFLTNPVKFGGPGYADICLDKYPEHMPDPYKPKEKGKKKQGKVGSPMLTVHYPQPYFHNNPYVDPSGKIGPTYVRPKEKKIPHRGTFMPTGPAKWQGGSHQGCFDPFPEWQTDRKPPKRGKQGPKKYFYPQSMKQKTMQTCSVLNRSVDLSINVNNCNTYEATYTKHLLD